MSKQSDSQYGLRWIRTTFGYEPRWTVEPDIDLIKQTVTITLSRINIPAAGIMASYLAQGAFNKLYEVEARGECFILRLALPVDPHWKTSSEVATLEWVHQNTSLPVPRILSYQTSSDTALAFEWILMTRLPGKPLAPQWHSISYPAKERLVRQIALYHSSAFRHQLSGIGSLFPHKPDSAASAGHCAQVGRIVSMQFFWADRVKYDVPRGPFRSGADWMAARLALCQRDCEATMERLGDVSEPDSDDEDDAEDARRTRDLVERLKGLVAIVFPSNTAVEAVEPSMISNSDLNGHNILVDEGGELTGVVDWECVAAAPLWKACDFPSFLEGSARDIEPKQHMYRLGESGEPDELYWLHLKEYEQTQLRRLFLGEMRRLEPQWSRVYESSRMQRDFDCAVQNCDSEFEARKIDRWIQDVTLNGKHASPLG